MGRRRGAGPLSRATLALAVAAGAGGYGAATTLLPAPVLLDPALALATAVVWLGAGWLAAAAVGAAGRLGAADPLGPAAGWVVGAAAAHVALGGSLAPARAELVATGPALAVWLTAGASGLLLQRSRAVPRADVLSRAALVWGAGWSAMWVGVSLSVLGGPGSVRTLLMALAAAATVTSVAAAGGMLGPPRLAGQVAALLLAQPLLAATAPDMPRALRSLPAALATGDRAPLLAASALATVPMVGVVAGCLLAWLRDRAR